jgi:hypothetical protein
MTHDLSKKLKRPFDAAVSRVMDDNPKLVQIATTVQGTLKTAIASL